MDQEPKKIRFAREYLVDQNGTQAAIRAGYSPASAHTTASRLLRDPQVQEFLAGKAQALAEELDISAKRVLQEMAKVAFSDFRSLFTQDGELKKPHELTAMEAAAVASIQVVTVEKGEGVVEHVAKIKTWDKTRGLEMLGRHLALFNDKLKVEDDALANKMAAARKRRLARAGKA
jgi:phage terminase small subunit